MRRKNDFYPTPEWAAEDLMDEVSIRGNVLEVCAGDGAIAKVIQRFTYTFRNDIEDTMPQLDFVLNAADPRSWMMMVADRSGTRFDWVVTNPPFNQAAQIVPLAYGNAVRGIAMLLRLSYLEPVKDRGAWLNAHPPTSMIVLPRISFTGDGKTDNVTCAWMVWDKSQVGTIKVAKNPKFQS